MKLLLCTLVCLAIVAADVSHLGGGGGGYNYPAPVRHEHHEEASAPIPAPAPEYLPPAPAPAPIPAPAPTPEYLPPQAEEIAPIVAESEPEPAHTFGDDGYQYRAVKRYRLRYRH